MPQEASRAGTEGGGITDQSLSRNAILMSSVGVVAGTWQIQSPG